MSQSQWIWDESRRQYRYWNGSCWVLQDGTRLTGESSAIASTTKAHNDFKTIQPQTDYQIYVQSSSSTSVPGAAQSHASSSHTSPLQTLQYPPSIGAPVEDTQEAASNQQWPVDQLSAMSLGGTMRPPTTETQITTKVVQGNKLRFLLAFDGTWNKKGDKTNVFRLHEYFVNGDVGNGFTQRKQYYEGVDGISGGLIGHGIDDRIIKGYEYLCQHVQRDTDEIVLTGFSRGAYTAWCLAGLLSDVGLRRGEDAADLITKWRHAREKNTFERDFGAQTPRTITAIALWDPVSSTMGRYAHVRKNTPRAVQNAFHALSLHEHRWAFYPEVWIPANTNTKLCWFPGFHSNVGGGIDNKNQVWQLTLCWMLDQLSPYIVINWTQLWLEIGLALDAYKSKFKDPYLKYFFGGSKKRTPGTHPKAPHDDSDDVNTVLETAAQTICAVSQSSQTTMQTMHWSVFKYIEKELWWRNWNWQQLTKSLKRIPADEGPGGTWRCRNSFKVELRIAEEPVRLSGAQYGWLRTALVILAKENPFGYLSEAAGDDDEFDTQIAQVISIAHGLSDYQVGGAGAH